MPIERVSQGFKDISMTFQVNPLTDDLIALNNANAIARSVRNIILTNPGERVMDVQYGVGINRYLFSSKIDVAADQIENKIRQQVQAYMPIIQIKSINFINQLDNNTLGISIVYQIPDIGTKDILEFAL